MAKQSVYMDVRQCCSASPSAACNVLFAGKEKGSAQCLLPSSARIAAKYETGGPHSRGVHLRIVLHLTGGLRGALS